MIFTMLEGTQGEIHLWLAFPNAIQDPDLLLAQRTENWLLMIWREDLVSLPILYQRGPNPIRTSATALKITKILEDHGRLILRKGGGVVGGQRYRDVWRIVRG